MLEEKKKECEKKSRIYMKKARKYHELINLVSNNGEYNHLKKIMGNVIEELNEIY